MSEGNVEIVRRSYDAYLRGDLESALAVCDPEIEIYDHDIPDSGEYRGFEGLARWQADWESSWESWRWDPEEFIEAGERVVAVLRVHARGREWRRCRTCRRCGVDAARRQMRATRLLRQQRAGPRSRRSVGVVRDRCFGRKAAPLIHVSQPPAARVGRAGWPEYGGAPTARFLRL